MEVIHTTESKNGREVRCTRYIGHGLHEDGTYVDGDELYLMDHGKDGVTRIVIRYPEDRSPERQARVMEEVQQAARACLQGTPIQRRKTDEKPRETLCV